MGVKFENTCVSHNLNNQVMAEAVLRGRWFVLRLGFSLEAGKAMHAEGSQTKTVKTSHEVTNHLSIRKHKSSLAAIDSLKLKLWPVKYICAAYMQGKSKCKPY
jgi:hypothetical protein